MKDTIPLINVSTQNGALHEEFMKAFDSILKSSAFILGPEVKEFEAEFKKYTGVPHAISCASGSDALLLPLMCAEVGPGDEVIVPSFTFYATAGAVSRLGATPVFCDSDETYNSSIADIQKNITPKTKAIIPVHLFGQMVDMLELKQALKQFKQRIYIIEDCAQSIGAALDGKQCGQWGDYGAYSFYPTKNLGAIGDAGMMSALSDDCAERLNMLRVHGSKQRYYHEFIGANSRLDSIQAAILRIKMRHLPKYEENRSRVATLYTKLFQEADLTKRIKLPITDARKRHVWNQYTIRVPERDLLRKHLADQGIGSEIYYPLAMHKQKAFIGENKPISLPVCEALEREVLSLPMFPELENKQVERVVAAVSDFYKSR